jgi:hypothetical protein
MTARTLTVSRTALDATLPFALPIGLSAFLLFSVEPLVGRLVLPVFGGAAGVWATILFFFQAVLLAGYLYGHLSVTRLGRWGPPIHLALAALAFWVLVNAPSRIDALRNEATTPVIDLIGILIALIGLPAFVLTTTTPLVSGWFHAVRDEERQGDPYWLYALSNAGSLAALLAYPLLIEPRLGLATQRGIWAVGYAILVVLIVWAAYRALPDIIARPRGYFLAPEQRLVGPAEASAAARAIDWRRRLRWLFLAAIPSGLLSAVTNFIATDLVSAPLLWVLPLALYLVSFIVAFSPRGRRLIGLAAAAAPAMVTLLWVPYGSAGGWPILVLVGTELVAFAVVAIALHGRLAQDRPDPDHLTEFYLILSTGGALASAFVAIVAPNLFLDIWEYPLLLVGALVALAVVAQPRAPAAPEARAARLDFGPFFAGLPGRILPYAVGAGLLAAALVATGSLATEAGIRWLAVGGVILLFGGQPWFLALTTGVVLALATLVLKPAAEFRDRSFFGVTEVLRVDDGEMTVLMNGTTVHGAQLNDPAERRTPISYYGANGPMGDIFAVGADSSALEPKRIAVVGLGAGGLAAYLDSWMSMTFFEIDPVVVEAASDPRFFTFLSDAPGRPDIVLGDARLSLAEEPDAIYDLLVMDAFTSDSVPVHLLTVEGIQEEVRTVVPDGLIAFNISSRYYDLAPAISAALAEFEFTTLKLAGAGDGKARFPSVWLAASRSSERVNELQARGWEVAVPADHPFTDDYADLLSYLKLGF